MPVITFGTKADKETADKHEAFVERMVERGYTTFQTKLLVSWFVNNKKSTG